MQPRPIAETSRSLLPSFRFFIFQSSDEGSYAGLSLRHTRFCSSCLETAEEGLEPWHSCVKFAKPATALHFMLFYPHEGYS